MDELLVAWLSSDNVYENVLNLIERYRSTAQSGSNGHGGTPSKSGSGSSATSPPSSPSRKSLSNAAVSASGGDSQSQSAGDGDGDGSDEHHNHNHHNSETSPRGVNAIPPFYRRAGTIASNGIKAPPIRRKDSFDAADQSWEGIYTNTDSSDQTQTQIHKNAQTNSNNTTNDGNDDEHIDGAGAGDNGSEGNSNNKPARPIKEQVHAIFSELGKKLEEDDGSDESLFLTMDNFVKITKDICSFPTFFNGPLYKRILYLWNTHLLKSPSQKQIIWNEFQKDAEELAGCLGIDPADEKEEDKNELLEHLDRVITYEIFRWYWGGEMEDYDASERFFRLLKKPFENYVGKDDFLPYMKELLRDHPGLEFLSNHAEFQDKYAITVITRIFYSVNKCHSGRITARQIRRSDLLSAFHQVDEEEDINKVTRYFSYEHFYVLYCRFWELDHDRDYKITREDLLKYGEQCLSHMIVDRIFDASPRPFGYSKDLDGEGDDDAAAAASGENKEDDANGNAADKDAEKKSPKDYLTYEDFIFFMLSEEDKANEISVRYWFTCIDVDGDGMLNNMEMRSFYALQQHRMQQLGHEYIPFEDMLCQMIDMIKPKNEEFIIVEDFLQEECAPVSGALFDALFNLNKYLQFEQRDPFQERQKREDEYESDWDRFACMDYNRLAMEEEAREEDAMEIDWVTVDDEDEDAEDFNLGLGGSSEAPF